MQGADSVILGCTEVGLILDPDALILPGFDSAVIHVQAAARFAGSGRLMQKGAPSRDGAPF
jgi:aspartate racemase